MSPARIEQVDPERRPAVTTLLAYEVYGGDLARAEKHLGEPGDVTFLAFVGDKLAGFVTLRARCGHPRFAGEAVPLLHHLLVFAPYRGRGLGAALLAAAEALAAERADRVVLSVGLHPGYGPAQRLYIRRGYVPLGEGICRGLEPVPEGATVTVDDGLLLWLVKDLRRAGDEDDR